MAKKEEVKKDDQKQATSVAEATAPSAIALAADFAADAGKGMEGADRESFAVPFLVMLQGLSPAVVDSLVDGAKPGLLMNSVTNDLFAVARVVPVAFKRVYLRWMPRGEGGGFKGERTVAQFEQLVREGKLKEVEDDKGNMRWTDDEGCQWMDTRVHFCLQVTERGVKPIILNMARTQIKRSRRWMTRINDIVMKTPDGKSYTPPSFSHVYSVKSEKETSGENTWFSYSVDMEGPVADPELYNAAKKFHEQIVAGKVRANFEQAQDTPESGGEDKSRF